jgi:hypothetical protein
MFLSKRRGILHARAKNAIVEGREPTAELVRKDLMCRQEVTS